MLPVCCPNERALREALFDQQVETLIERGWHRTLEMAERDIRLWFDLLRDRLGEIGEVPPEHIPFVIVVPHAMLPVTEQMRLLVIAEKHGYAGLDGEKLVNFEDLGSSEFPYLVCDVENGSANVGQTTADAVTSIRRACRCGLTGEEGIALATHCPDLLLHHALALADTECRKYVLELWLGSGGPTLNFDFPKSRKEDRGVPSCARRLLLDRE